MSKTLSTVLLCFFLSIAFAQKRDTTVYYLTKSNKIVSTKDSADFYLVIYPPDTNVNKNLFPVSEFYKNEKKMLIGNSMSNSLKLKFHGVIVWYYPNGRKMRVASYDNGLLLGEVTEYYPNGNFYNSKSYAKDKRVSFNECRDSTRKILTEKGNGVWKEYLDDKFDKNYITGDVVQGLQQGRWRGIIKDSSKIDLTYQDGNRIFSNNINGQIFTSVEQVPEFPEGLEAFYHFIVSNIHFPEEARHSGISGRVIISFVVNVDGSLTDIKVARGIGGGCDEEALRIIRLSPRWKPGIQNGHPVRVAYNVPISFKLGS